jgi:CrcB protein
VTAHPVDTDVEVNAVHRRIDPRIIGVIAIGGFVGGLARYEIVRAWTATANEFPWSTFVVNTIGAFVLALLVVVTTDVLVGSRYLRPLLGTGFCGAFTTFSAVAVSVDELTAHGHTATAASYAIASVVAGSAAATAGVVLGRAIPKRDSSC